MVILKFWPLTFAYCLAFVYSLFFFSFSMGFDSLGGIFIPSIEEEFYLHRLWGSLSEVWLTYEDETLRDDVEGLLRDALNMHNRQPNDESNVGINEDLGDGAKHISVEEPTGDAAKFHKLLESMNEPLYEGFKYSKLAFSIRLFHLKCLSGMTSKAMDLVLKLLQDVFPFAAIPKSSCDSKRIIRDLGFVHEKIETLAVKKQPAKVLRYFPLIPRLQRIFMSNKTSESMTWHDDERTKDGSLRHPSNSLAWKAFDVRYPEFASDPRNVRLGLAADDASHPFRLQKRLFDNTVELHEAPSVTSGSNILEMLKDVNFSVGKDNQSSRKNANSSSKARKREHNLLRQNLDVMHIEKNVCENLVGTILNIDGKSKDNPNTRLDLVEMGIRRGLHPKSLSNGKTLIPPASYGMSKDENDVLPSFEEHQALRSSMSKQVTLAITELCNKALCPKVLKVDELDKL
ncbi:Transposon, En/Spm-like protein [Corchorus capsularis]|uniref:Transposon, En/Spm-like protein n=1 Tax=Corchorus capsularis TaxID=210143 RepID=A0A1R3FXI8_COCAP|nr:Transposon, En/Spm-like protein [Corchorus capsularis]